MTENGTILATGATGYVGPRLVTRLLVKGEHHLPEQPRPGNFVPGRPPEHPIVAPGSLCTFICSCYYQISN